MLSTVDAGSKVDVDKLSEFLLAARLAVAVMTVDAIDDAVVDALVCIPTVVSAAAEVATLVISAAVDAAMGVASTARVVPAVTVLEDGEALDVSRWVAVTVSASSTVTFGVLMLVLLVEDFIGLNGAVAVLADAVAVLLAAADEDAIMLTKPADDDTSAQTTSPMPWLCCHTP